MNNINAIQQQLIKCDLDAVIIMDEKNQRYATGFAFTDGAVVVGREKAWLITDSRYIEAAENTSSDCCTVQMYDREHSRLSLVRAALKECSAQRVGAEEMKLSHWEFTDLEEKLEVGLLPAQKIFSTLRASKNEEEIRFMRRAQEISEAALEETLPLIKAGVTEHEVAAELVYRMLRHGSEGNSFDPIVITGAKTSMPHGVPGDEVIKDGDFITMDFGSIKGGYCSDMTRTVAVGHVTDEMKNVYDTVLRAQLAGIAAARAGIPGREIDLAARKVIEDAGYGRYFGHSFGHSLGLDIHEIPGAGPGSSTLMPVGAVVSAEPGIYLPGKFGVRIEDVMILREDGCEVITKAPKQLIIL